ncbi:MAG: DUF4443 domain-containing protein [Candidatus Nanosalina sp.]
MLELENLNVGKFHAYAAIYLIGEKHLGRRRLAEELGLTESKTRTMLKHLKNSGYIQTGDKTRLTSEGEKILSEIQERLQKVSEADLGYLGMGEEAVAALVKLEEDFNVIQLRDEAVRAGARGLTVLEHQKNFTFPEDEDPEEERFKKDTELLEEIFAPEKGDKLLISSGDSEEDARKGLWRALHHLLQR